jgi:tRNA threonylcarbamoyladenosine modification (KEOPS) complex Cgi121 subunit
MGRIEDVRIVICTEYYFLQISESLKLFSAQDGDTNILVLGEKQLFQKLHEQIDGQEVPLESISEFTDVELLKKVYQIPEEELTNSNLQDSVISRMASKEFSNISLTHLK